MCVALQIAKSISQDIFLRGNMLDTVELFLKILKRREIRYLLKYENLDGLNKKRTKAIDSVFSNLKTYLTELMVTKGPRNKLATSAFRTVVAACSGPNLRENRVLTQAGNILVSHTPFFFVDNMYPGGAFYLKKIIVMFHHL